MLEEARGMCPLFPTPCYLLGDLQPRDLEGLRQALGCLCDQGHHQGRCWSSLGHPSRTRGHRCRRRIRQDFPPNLFRPLPYGDRGFLPQIHPAIWPGEAFLVGYFCVPVMGSLVPFEHPPRTPNDLAEILIPSGGFQRACPGGQGLAQSSGKAGH